MFGQSWLCLALVTASIFDTASSSIATSTAPPRYAATYIPAASELFRRAGSCPANTFQCSESLGAAFSGYCCRNGQSCALDANNNPACCPSGAVCTGTAPATVATGTPAAEASYVSNSYFAFPYAPSSYADSNACKSAVSACSKNYDTCLTVLEDGSGYGVTIDVPGGGGTTVNGDGSQLGTSATPICSSLSSKACAALDATQCSSFGSFASQSRRIDFALTALATAIGFFNAIS